MARIHMPIVEIGTDINTKIFNILSVPIPTIGILIFNILCVDVRYHGSQDKTKTKQVLQHYSLLDVIYDM